MKSQGIFCSNMMVSAAGTEDAVNKGTGTKPQGNHSDGDHGTDSHSGTVGNPILSQKRHHPIQTETGNHRDDCGHQKNRSVVFVLPLSEETDDRDGRSVI